jgi:hypothetical protein
VGGGFSDDTKSLGLLTGSLMVSFVIEFCNRKKTRQCLIKLSNVLCS